MTTSINFESQEFLLIPESQFRRAAERLIRIAKPTDKTPKVIEVERTAGTSEFTRAYNYFRAEAGPIIEPLDSL